MYIPGKGQDGEADLPTLGNFGFGAHHYGLFPVATDAPKEPTLVSSHNQQLKAFKSKNNTN
jgi:hypothetical protein